MYEAYYGLQERPFDLTPNPRFLFMTSEHREALSTIQYGIAGRKGVTLLLGPAGTGKTTLVHAALERQQGANAKALYLSNSTLRREEFVEFLAYELELSRNAARSKTHFLRELNATLVERQAAGLVTALIVDEAQAMPDALLEEVRLLANMETATEKLLPVVLVGQLELGERLNSGPLQQLKQRVALRSTLAPLTAQETAAYVAERIRIAGGDVRAIFRPEAVAAIYQCSGGIPRTISVVCDNALVSGFATDEKPIGRGIIVEVSRDFDLPVPGQQEAAVDEFVASAVAFTRPAPAAAPIAPSPVSAPVAAPASSMMILPPPPVDAPRQSLLAYPTVLTIPSAAMSASMAPAPAEPAEPAEPAAPRRRGLRALFQRRASR